MNLIGVNSPVRLLREKWSNPVDLAHELYAMFTAKGPAELHDTLTIKVLAGKTALRIESVDNSVSTTSFSHGGISKNSVSTAPSVPGRRLPPPPSPQTPRLANGSDGTGASFGPSQPQVSPSASPIAPRSEVPLVEIQGSVAFSSKAPIQFNQPPVIVNPRTGRQEQLATTDQISKAAPDTFKVFWGIVTEGTGDTYQARFYSPGFAGNGQGIYTVQIPDISPDEQIPPGTKLFPIWLISGVYYHQPTVWSE